MQELYLWYLRRREKLRFLFLFLNYVSTNISVVTSKSASTLEFGPLMNKVWGSTTTVEFIRDFFVELKEKAETKLKQP
jgi:hypothetical protein